MELNKLLLEANWASPPSVLTLTTTALYVSKTPKLNSTLFVKKKKKKKDRSYSDSISRFWKATITDMASEWGAVHPSLSQTFKIVMLSQGHKLHIRGSFFQVK